MNFNVKVLDSSENEAGSARFNIWFFCRNWATRIPKTRIEISTIQIGISNHGSERSIVQQAMSNLLTQQSMVKMGKTFYSFSLFLVDSKVKLSFTSTDHKYLTLKRGFGNA